MDFDDDQVKKNRDYLLGSDLSNFSVDELRILLTLIDDEKLRVQQELELKEAKKLTADSFFKK